MTRWLTPRYLPTGITLQLVAHAEPQIARNWQKPSGNAFGIGHSVPDVGNACVVSAGGHDNTSLATLVIAFENRTRDGTMHFATSIFTLVPPTVAVDSQSIVTAYISKNLYYAPGASSSSSGGAAREGKADGMRPSGPFARFRPMAIAPRGIPDGRCCVRRRHRVRCPRGGMLLHLALRTKKSPCCRTAISDRLR